MGESATDIAHQVEARHPLLRAIEDAEAELTKWREYRERNAVMLAEAKERHPREGQQREDERITRARLALRSTTEILHAHERALERIKEQYERRTEPQRANHNVDLIARSIRSAARDLPRLFRDSLPMQLEALRFFLEDRGDELTNARREALTHMQLDGSVIGNVSEHLIDELNRLTEGEE